MRVCCACVLCVCVLTLALTLALTLTLTLTLTLALTLKAMAEMEAPACPAGGVILFDYRVMHRGLPNGLTDRGGRERPVAYAVCSTGAAWDRANFPRTTIDHPDSVPAGGFPKWAELEDTYVS